MNDQKKQLEQKLAQESHEKMAKEIELLHAADDRSRITDQTRSLREEVETLRSELASEREKRENAEQSLKQTQFEYQQRIQQVSRNSSSCTLPRRI